MTAGRLRVPVVLKPVKGRIFLSFGFNRTLLNEIKAMQGAKWHGFDKEPKKEWSILNSARNRFQLDHLCGFDPYAPYDVELLNVQPNRGRQLTGGTLYEHQVEMFQHGITRRQCIFACEMRTGKTLVSIEVMEHSDVKDWIWVGPKGTFPEIKLQFEDWGAKVMPRFMTYDRLRKEVKEETIKIPDGIIFDESTKIKNYSAMRSQAAGIVCEEMRKKDPECYIILMSGAPSPKNPADWWHQCEVACPGFIREGDSNKFKKRLALIKEKESIAGGTYPELVTWLDDEKKCNVCGKLNNEHYSEGFNPEDHTFEPSVNEVSYLYKRMQGLVLVKFRNDCLDLPETQHREIVVEPSPSVKRAANLLVQTGSSAVATLMLTRELSDGFQYIDEQDGFEECNHCSGTKNSVEWFDPENPDDVVSEEALSTGRCEQREETCPACRGSGKTPKIKRIAKEVPCPKEEVLNDLLEEHEPIGRFVVFAGFRASIDRCVATALKNKWDVIRVDGRGWTYFAPLDGGDVPESDKEMLKRFQNKHPNKIVFIGQPGAAGMGLTLTASPSIFFYSNTFNAEDRIQASARIVGIGMDKNRGATIIDVIHLDTDRLVLKNLQKKIDLNNLTMGKLRDAVMEKNNG